MIISLFLTNTQTNKQTGSLQLQSSALWVIKQTIQEPAIKECSVCTLHALISNTERDGQNGSETFTCLANSSTCGGGNSRSFRFKGIKYELKVTFNKQNCLLLCFSSVQMNITKKRGSYMRTLHPGLRRGVSHTHLAQVLPHHLNEVRHGRIHEAVSPGQL